MSASATIRLPGAMTDLKEDTRYLVCTYHSDRIGGVYDGVQQYVVGARRRLSFAPRLTSHVIIAVTL